MYTKVQAKVKKESFLEFYFEPTEKLDGSLENTFICITNCGSCSSCDSCECLCDCFDCST
mgnify:FL=1